MFESNSARSGSAVNRTAVTLAFMDGSTANVTIKLPLTARIADALNNADQFLDVVDAEGRQKFLSKHMVGSVALFDAPKASLNTQRRAADHAPFNPHAVLGVGKGSDAAAIKRAYHDLVRKYHPDRFANFDLPKEMLDYAAAMLVRLNLAYEQIGG